MVQKKAVPLHSLLGNDQESGHLQIGSMFMRQ